MRLFFLKNKKVIIALFFSFVFLASGLFLLWRVNQKENLSTTDSSANCCGTCDCIRCECYTAPVYLPHPSCMWYEPFEQFINIDAVRHEYWKDGYCDDGAALNGRQTIHGLRWLFDGTTNPVDWQCKYPSDSKPFRWFFYRYSSNNGCTLSAQNFDGPPPFNCTHITTPFKGGKINDTYVWLAARKGNITGMPVTAVPKSGYRFEKWDDGNTNATRTDLYVTASKDIKAVCSKIPDPVCGDGSCNGTENASSCPKDCPAKCGDGSCTHNENASSCPKDCPAKCGDGSCTHNENATNCPKDCPANCGDGKCTHDENASSCPKDCPAKCGDKFCTNPENANTCPDDCKEQCGDGFCTHTEDASVCPLDCTANCGDGKCTHDENASSCPKDCPAKCGDNVCTHEENESSCPIDCQKEGVVVPQTGIFDDSRNIVILGVVITFIGISFNKIWFLSSLFFNQYHSFNKQNKSKKFEKRVLKE